MIDFQTSAGMDDPALETVSASIAKATVWNSNKLLYLGPLFPISADRIWFVIEWDEEINVAWEPTMTRRRNFTSWAFSAGENLLTWILIRHLRHGKGKLEHRYILFEKVQLLEQVSEERVD